MELLASLGFLEVTAASVARISLSEIREHHVSEIQSTFLEQSGHQTFEAGWGQAFSWVSKASCFGHHWLLIITENVYYYTPSSQALAGQVWWHLQGHPVASNLASTVCADSSVVILFPKTPRKQCRPMATPAKTKMHLGHGEWREGARYSLHSFTIQAHKSPERKTLVFPPDRWANWGSGRSPGRPKSHSQWWQ